MDGGRLGVYLMNGPISLPGFHLLDLSALVAGYAMASLLVRAFWPTGGSSEAAVFVVLGLAYLWLGLAMSGPLILAVRRRGDREDPAEPHEALTWAELAWSIIGFYWIGLTVLVVPVRLPHTRLVDTALLGVFPILAALGLRLFGPKRPATPGQGPGWTHLAGVVLLVSWPLAWLAMILLGKTL